MFSTIVHLSISKLKAPAVPPRTTGCRKTLVWSFLGCDDDNKRMTSASVITPESPDLLLLRAPLQPNCRHDDGRRLRLDGEEEEEEEEEE